MENLKVNKLKINKLKTNELNKAKINKLSKVNINKTYKSKIKNNKEKVISKAKYTGLYFVLPSLIGVAVFTLLPFLDVFLRSFQSAISREFVGIENYIEVYLKVPIEKLIERDQKGLYTKVLNKEAANVMAEGIKRVFPNAEYVLVPMADGGEGTVQSLVDTTNGQKMIAKVHNPLNKLVNAEYGILGDGETAVMSKAASGGLQSGQGSQAVS